MNKVIALFILLITINFANELNIDQNLLSSIYDKFLFVVEGMSAEKKRGCLDNLIENKDTYLPELEKIIELIINGNEASYNFDLSNIFNYGSLIVDCKIFDFLGLLGKFNNSRVLFFQDIGKNIENNAEKFHEGTSKFVRKRTVNDRLVLIGKISSAILNITFD